MVAFCPNLHAGSTELLINRNQRDSSRSSGVESSYKVGNRNYHSQQGSGFLQVFHPYTTEEIADFNITVASIQKPSASLENKRCAISTNTSYMLPTNFRIPVACNNPMQPLNRFPPVLTVCAATAEPRACMDIESSAIAQRIRYPCCIGQKTGCPW